MYPIPNDSALMKEMASEDAWRETAAATAKVSFKASMPFDIKPSPKLNNSPRRMRGDPRSTPPNVRLSSWEVSMFPKTLYRNNGKCYNKGSMRIRSYVLYFLLGAYAALAHAGGTIRGKVVSGLTGKPVAGVSVG